MASEDEHFVWYWQSDGGEQIQQCFSVCESPILKFEWENNSSAECHDGVGDERDDGGRISAER